MLDGELDGWRVGCMKGWMLDGGLDGWMVD